MERLYQSLRVTLIALLAFGLSFVLLDARAARAELVSTESVLTDASTSPGTRDRAHALLARAEVARELADLGIDPEQAKARVDALSDAELAAVVGRLDELPAGGDAAGAILGALLIVFIVLLITDIVGATDVFPFVKGPDERNKASGGT